MTRLPWDHPARQEKSDGRYIRERSADPYHTARWTRLSRAFRAGHPLCAECGRKGIIKVADRFFEDDELNRIALAAPEATVTVSPLVSPSTVTF